ncbi:hypothetical protein NDU88_005828 [Pleurodeles waltl]|uniref:Uncharacterized protein n=1 Tax=Pleurodeles waltl TaxID=8319 RepID=A0AAV7LT61_PLEWA|nr:hypothetical protein NDU88_005828 [Pleurodeles waltl]
MLLTGDNEENPDDFSPWGEYVMDIDLEDPDGDDFLMEEDVPSTSDNVIRDALGEEMFSPDKIKHPRSAEW